MKNQPDEQGDTRRCQQTAKQKNTTRIGKNEEKLTTL